MVRRVVFYALVVVVLSAFNGACQEGNPSSGGQGGAGGAAGTGGAAPKDNAAVTSPDDCFYDGSRGLGGSDFIYCHTITVGFEPALDLQDTITLSTDLRQDVPVEDSHLNVEDAWKSVSGEKVTALLADFTTHNPAIPTLYPATATVRVAKAGGATTEKTFSSFHYTCVARTSDDWCWEAEPVVFSGATAAPGP
ncbi:MAG: hypothetical protein QOI66_3438 [Myxococcales bacterium]|nr:hypothetical protein [Myxococcales bacterium]